MVPVAGRGGRLGELRRMLTARADLRSVVLAAVVAWIASRLIAVAITYLAVSIWANPGHATAFLKAWNQWDTGSYQSVAARGYWAPVATAFYPVYPGLIAGFTWLAGGTHGPAWPAFAPVPLVVALVISNLGALAGLIGLALLAWNEDRSVTVARRTVQMAVAYPWAFMLVAGYSEGLFLPEAAFCLLFARRGRWLACGAVGLLAGLTRPTALVLVPAVLWELIRQRRSAGPDAPSLVRGAVGVSGVPLAIAGYMGFLWWRFGNPFISLWAESHYWGRHLAWPWTTAHAIAHVLRAGPHWTQNEIKIVAIVVAVLAVLAVTLLGLRSMPFAFSLYMLGLIALSVASPMLTYYEVIGSAGRFLVVSVPVFLLMGRWISRRPALDFPVFGLLLVFQAMLAAAYVIGVDGIQ
jgi:hypothetical protein